MENSNKDNNKVGTGSKTEMESESGYGKLKSETGNGDKERSESVLGNATATKRRGRKKKELSEEDKIQKDKDKFFVDVSRDKEQRQLIQNLLSQANNKSYGREVILKDLVLISLPKLTSKDIEKIQEHSLSEMERVQRALDEHNRKSEAKLTLGEFLVKRLALH